MFDVTVEDMRMRADYEKFRAERAAEEELAFGTPIHLDPMPPYRLKGYDPELDYRIKDHPTNGLDVLPRADLDLLEGHPPPNYFVPEAPTIYAWMGVAYRSWDYGPPPGDAPPAGGPDPDGPSEPHYNAYPAHSVAIVVVQASYVHDNDSFGDVSAFDDPESYLEALSELEETAEALSTFSITVPTGNDSGGWVEALTEMRDQITAAEPIEMPGATFVLLRDGDAHGTVVDGEAVDEMPVLADLLPVFLREPEEDAAEDDAETETSGTAEAKDGVSGNLSGPQITSETTTENSVSVDDGSEDEPNLVFGANTSINEAAVTTNWLDAPVIAVHGDVTRIDAISQINILSNRDSMDDGSAPEASTVLNAARIVQEHGASFKQYHANSEDALPSHWMVTRLEGDLVAFDWIKQYNFTIDNDRAEISIGGHDTWLTMGGNSAINLATLKMFGVHYDMIMVGGQMIDITMLKQTNVLLDDDTVTGAGAANVSGGDNLLYNSAEIARSGVDSYSKLTDPFEKALDELADGAKTIGADLAADSLFAGLEVLRVLYIAGDFVKMTLAEQINVMGDSDQVSLALGDFELALGSPAEVVTGSNALANLAHVQNDGLDSTVMAGGNIYSAALIHQAGMVDEGAAPTGVGLMPGLANEAVAFLADDMIDPPTTPANDDVAQTALGSMDSSQVDVMQTMLA